MTNVKLVATWERGRQPTCGGKAKAKVNIAKPYSLEGVFSIFAFWFLPFAFCLRAQHAARAPSHYCMARE
jgi:hypothetical protein